MKKPFETERQMFDALRAAYAERERMPVTLDARWQADVMREIRRSGALNQPSAAGLWERFVWRAAAAACAVVVILSVYAGVNGWNPVEAAQNLLWSNPVEFTVAQAFGAYETTQ